MKIPIKIKLAGAYLMIIFAMIIMVYYALQVNKNIYINEIGRSSLLLAEEMFKRMDQRLFHLTGQLQIQTKTPSVQERLSLSNKAFDHLENVREYMEKKDKEWISIPGATTPFIKEIISNPTARELTDIFIDFFGRQYGYTLIQEIILTNKHGATVAISIKTSDYNQADEEWWQQARDKGIYLGRLLYNENASDYGIDLAIRIGNLNGEFAGVLKVGLNVKDIIRAAEVGTRKYDTTHIRIITTDGRLIYSTKPHRFIEDVSHKSFFRHLKTNEGFFIAREAAQPKLFSFTQSRGFNYFKGLGWTLIISHQLNEVLEPYSLIQKKIIGVSCPIILFCIILIYALGRMVTSPLKNLTDGIKRISEGDLTHRVTVKNNDEFGEVSSAFNMMIEKMNRAEDEKAIIENQLSQAQKMEAIGTLAGGIAHDFNNILAIIFGYTEMAKDDAPRNSKLKNDLENVLEAANRAKELVQQILAFSRQTKIERIPIQLQSLIKEALKMLRSSIPATIEIHDEIDSDCGIVLADPTQIHQILMNLCTNANHAMETSGGTLKIKLKNTCIDKKNQISPLDIVPGKYVELIVSDTGSGIGHDEIDRIFDPYFTTKALGRGTGMGLAIIHGIVADYGGHIAVETELGKGSTFHVYFPVMEREALPIVKETERIPLGMERILFIDDEELLVRMGKDLLERLGYDVTIRQNSLDALLTFQKAPGNFDVVITDQTMPDMSGAVLARKMLQIRPDIPIILCTGYSNLIDEKTAKSFGIREFALKPLTKSTIAKLLRKVLDNA